MSDCPEQCPCERCVERRANLAILAWCRKVPREAYMPVMRDRVLRFPGEKVVIDLGRGDEILAHAPTWLACLAALREKGFKI